LYVSVEMATKPSQAEMADWFKEIDADGSGKIDMKELRAVIKAFYDWQNTAADDAKIDADTAVRLLISRSLSLCTLNDFPCCRLLSVS